MKTKNKISGYVLRTSVAGVLFFSMIVGITSAFNCSNGSATSSWRLILPGSVPKVPTQLRQLSVAERVAYQRAIEDVYWHHRIWPKERPDPKPPLDAVMSQAQIEKKVEDYLRDSQALEDYWQKPITPDQLQAEMDRMAHQTKRPQVLREIFHALGDDPFVIAECLARSVLAQRLITDLNNNKRVSLTKVAWLTTALQPKKVAAIDLVAEAGRVNHPYQLPAISNPSGTCIDDTWTATSLTNAPTARNGHTAVWTGSEMIIWGGHFFDGSHHYYNTGGRYNPSTDSWTASSTTNAPSARAWHTAVWTGSEMIVWGGHDSSSELNTGGRYNPSTDSWTATSTTNAPSGRQGHTAVLIGSEMIVWGGNDGTNNLNTGGRYNPSTDSWAATSTTNAPSGRQYHTAVSTGSEMIVWGGAVNNTGGRYDPGTDSWTATSTTSAPTARENPTAVWTGSEMIVWGGVDQAGNVFNTGGRYHLGTDSWVATSTTNAPAARVSHTAVWTGSEMIVWGGLRYMPIMYFNTGGRYTPDSDSWTAASTTNAPAARYGHTAVWTGSEMIVWGGYSDPTGYLNTGGRYCAQSGPPPTPTPTATASTTPTPTATATATATSTPTPTARPVPTPRSRPTPAPRP